MPNYREEQSNLEEKLRLYSNEIYKVDIFPAGDDYIRLYISKEKISKAFRIAESHLQNLDSLAKSVIKSWKNNDETKGI